MKKYSLVYYWNLPDYGCECCEEPRSRDHEVAALRYFCTPGSVAGLPGNRYSYATFAIAG